MTTNEHTPIVGEKWLPVVGLEGFYEVSNLARLRSVPHPTRRLNRFNILKPTLNNSGYLIVRYRIGKDRAVKAMLIHREMAKAFLPNPDNLPEVNHVDGNKLNNTLENFEWSTRKGNVNHGFKNGLYPVGEGHGQSKLTSKNVKEIRRKYIPGIYSQYKLAKEYGVSQTTIRFVILNKTWREVK